QHGPLRVRFCQSHCAGPMRCAGENIVGYITRLLRRCLGFALLVALPLAGAEASVVGQWNGGGRTWDDPSFAATRAAVVGAGNTVKPAAAITSGELAGDDLFIIFEPTVGPTGSELALLSTYVSSGGTLVIFGESSASPTVMNAILAGVGSSMSYGTSTFAD